MYKNVTCKDCTIKKVLEYLGQENNKMYKWILRDIFSDSQYYNGNKKEKLLARSQDISYGGCISGTVSALIYYSDTTKFFDKFKKEIVDLVKDLQQEGIINSLNDLNDFDKDDPFCEEVYNKNLLAWLAYEEVNQKLLWYLES